MMGRAVTPRNIRLIRKREAQAIAEVERTVTNIQNYNGALEGESGNGDALDSERLAGGYAAPTSGGDAVNNPQVPTGRNL